MTEIQKEEKSIQKEEIGSTYLEERQTFIFDTIKKAISIAEKGIEYDNEQDYRLSLEEYKKVEEALKSIQDELTGNSRVRVTELLTLYGNRIKEILPVVTTNTGGNIKAHSLKQVISKQDFKYTFKPVTERILQEEQSQITEKPKQNIHRPFHIMRILLKSIYDGTMLTVSVRIPNEIFFQSETSLLAINDKLDTCNILIENFMRIKNNRDISETSDCLKDLVSLTQQLNVIQNSLARILPFIPEVMGKEKKKSTRFKSFRNKKRGKIPTTVEYIEAITHVIQNSQFLDTWISYYESKEVIHKENLLKELTKVSSFLDQVFLNFVLRDLATLLETHLVKTQLNFFKL
ncbi:hypothetical protein M0813_07968 [Anaeramoeba flamelloides]|uniref:Uncharacterized protein n=1 Tax=Anaeramoeba flamelloides TaxID=1746091 RepID=A0ABQ8XDH5_9EUKA|nr:hypothetical protein M0813_07968 [Anaeramoeba flamelloides]